MASRATQNPHKDKRMHLQLRLGAVYTTSSTQTCKASQRLPPLQLIELLHGSFSLTWRSFSPCSPRSFVRTICFGFYRAGDAIDSCARSRTTRTSSVSVACSLEVRLQWILVSCLVLLVCVSLLLSFVCCLLRALSPRISDATSLRSGANFLLRVLLWPSPFGR